MRPRHTLLLLALASLPVLLALALVGSGSLDTPGRASSASTGVGTTKVALALLGGPARVAAMRCGKLRSYVVFPSRGSIRFVAAITPSRHSTFELKLKACYGGQFQSAGSVHPALGAGGISEGTFPTPIAGYYYARGEARRAGREIGRSLKVYFEVR
ncbi:MAG: hypothetical protein KGL15_12340 [Acidobacteriota bacterium]|nr:hypothetical protein [Acidobacteriota bacterium]